MVIDTKKKKKETIYIEFSEEEIDKIMKYWERCGTDSVQEAILHAIETAKD